MSLHRKALLFPTHRRFLDIMQQEVRLINNHYQLPLPLRQEEPGLSNNHKMAVKGVLQVKKRMLRDETYHNDYINFMSDLMKKGYAKKADCDKDVLEGWTWYVPHHGVYHPKTKKFRVVMDCSAEFEGRSLNAELLQGPDTTNNLLGVLIRFRRYGIPFMGDIEAMFYQVTIPEQHRSLVRFLWWPDGDVGKDLCEFEMGVHLFGTVLSPSCAGFALPKAASDSASLFREDAAKAVHIDFYVDDLLKSEETPKEASNMILGLQSMCAAGGFNLTKFVSNDKDVLDSIPVEKKAKGYKDCDLSRTSLPVERALGVHWCIESDQFGFRIIFQDKPLSRRTILSTVSSIYDPLGVAGPFLI